MKRKFTVLTMFILFISQACNTESVSETTEAGSVQIDPVISTSVVSPNLVALPTLGSVTEASGQGDSQPVPGTGISLDDNGKTFSMHVGDSLLLNLGTDAYDWTAFVDNEKVLRMKVGVMVIKGAQGIFDALSPGTTILSASGDPLCRKSRPACAMPSILFSITIVVE